MARMTRADLSLQVHRKNLAALLDTSPAFRKFCWTILSEASIFYPTYSRVSPHDTSHNEGRRALGLEVLHMLTAAHPGVLAMIEADGLTAARTPTESEDDNEDPALPDADGDER